MALDPEIKTEFQFMREQFAQITGKLTEHDGRFGTIEGKLTEHDGRFNSLDETLDELARATASEFGVVRSEMEEGFEKLTAHIVKVDIKLQNQIDAQADAKADRREVSQLAAQVRNFQR